MDECLDEVLETDIAILGAGIAGSAAGVLLSSLGFKVHIFEREAEQAAANERGEILPPEALRILTQFIDQEEFDAVGDRIYSRASTWGEEKLTHKSFLTSIPGFALQIHKSSLIGKLRRNAKSKGTSFFFKEKVIGCEPNPHAEGDCCPWRLVTKLVGGEVRSVTARMVVDATGRSRAFARKLSSIEKFDRLTAIVAVLSQQPRGGNHRLAQSSLVEPIEDGWWFASRQNSGECFVSRFVDANRHATTMHRNAKSFFEACKTTRYIAGFVGLSQAKIVNRPRVYAASSTKMNSVCGPGWITIGDAAFTVDPLSSHGICNALEQADMLYQHLRTNPVPLSDLSPLEAVIDDRFHEYMSLRDKMYSLEMRWPENRFWLLRRP